MDNGGIREAVRHLRTLAGVRTAAALSDRELVRWFAEAHDEAAFTALMERHGPMVLGVCRRILRHSQDAEDACQATFLVLARKAGSVRKPPSLASWLYGVAARTARKLRASRARRGQVPGCRAEAVADAAGDDPSWREVCAVLDEELCRLPEKYRAPLVLCHLEGLTRDEAAHRLGLSLNRLRGRLDYGRGLLRSRLIRRGVGLPAVLLAGLLARQASAAVPALLTVTTVKAAALTAAGRALPVGLVPARVAALTEGMVRTMLLAKFKVAGVVLLLAALGLGVSAVLQSLPAAEPPPPAKLGDDPVAKPAAGTFKPDWLEDPLYRVCEALVAWWPGEGHAFDLVGPSHGERIGSAAFARGCCGIGFSFPDDQGAAYVKRQAGLVDTFTLMMWVYPNATREAAPPHRYAGISGQRYAIYPTHGGEAGKEAGCGISAGTNGIGLFEHTHDNLPCVLEYETSIKDWTHVAVVYARGVPTLYVNGEAVKTGARSAWTVFPGTYISDPNTGYGPYQGLIDEPMVFDRDLSGDEIKVVFRATRMEKLEGKAGAALSDAEFVELGSYLSGERASRSLFAIQRLAAGGDEAVRRLRPLVIPVAVPDKPSVEELVRQLDDDDFQARERAKRLLIEKGARVVPKLRDYLKGSPSVEARVRIGRILEHFGDVGPTAEELRALRAVTVLSRIATPAGRELLAELADRSEETPATIAAKVALGRSEKKSDK
jgi:RNA polymerase sigma factor (sigma-70 family)